MTGEACFNEGFSIRGYVADVRKRDIEKCWPFHPQLFESRVKDCAKTVLPLLEVPTFNYWKYLADSENGNICQEGSEQRKDLSQDNITIDGEIKHVKPLHEIQNAEQFIDIMETPVLNAESPCLPREEERYVERVAKVLSGDMESEKILSGNKLNIYCETDEIVSNNSLKQLASKRAVIGANNCPAHLEKENPSCSAIICSTASSYGEKDPKFVNKETDKPLSGFSRLNILEKVPILQPAIARCLVERTVPGNQNQLFPRNDVEQVLSETLLTSQCTLTTVRNAQDLSTTQASAQMGTHGLLLNIKGNEFKKLREKRRQILREKSKHTRFLMADVINFPSKAIDCKIEYASKGNNCIKQGKSHSGAHFGFVQKNLVLKSPLESVTSQAEEIVNDKKNHSTADQYRLEKRENDIQQKIRTAYMLSNAPTHKLRKLKVKRKCHCETHSVCVHNKTVPDKSTSEFFSFPCEQIVTGKTNDNSMAHCSIEERENDIEHKKILDKDKWRSHNSVNPNLSKFKVQNDLFPDKTTPESFTSPFEQIMSDKTNDNNTIMYKQERQEKDIKQNKTLNKLMLSNIEMQGFRKLKVKRNHHCKARFGFVKHELVSDKSIPDSFTTSFAHTVDEKTTASNSVTPMVVEKENDFEQKKIPGNQRLSSAAKKSSMSLEAKRKHLYETHSDSVQNDCVPDKSIPEAFTSPFEHIGNGKTNDRSVGQDTLDKSENDIEQDEIFNKQRLLSSPTNNFRSFCCASPQKSIPGSFTPPFEEIVNEKTKGSAVHSKLGYRQNNIKQKKILEEKILSKMVMHNSRKLKAKRKYCSEEKSFSVSFTPPFEEVLNEKTNDSRAALYTHEKKQNGIEQEEIFNKKRLSKAATHNFRKFKVKSNCRRAIHSDFVQHEFDSDKLTPESLTSPFEEIVSDKTNISSTDPSAQEKRENEIKQKKIVDKPRLANAVIQELGVHDGDMQDCTAPDIAVSEPLDTKSEYRGGQRSILSMSSISIGTKRKWKKKLLENEFFSPDATESMKARQTQGTWWEQFPTARTVPVSGGFAVHPSGSSVTKQRPVIQPQAPSFGQGTMPGASKALSKGVCDRDKFVRRVNKPQETPTHRGSHNFGAITERDRMSPRELKDMEGYGVEQILEEMASKKGNCNSSKYRKRAAELPCCSNAQSGVTKSQKTQTHCGSHKCGAITEGDRMSPKELKDREGCSVEQILNIMASKKASRNSSNFRKRKAELPCSSNGQSKKKNIPTTSNIGREHQETKEPGRSNIAILALPAFHKTT